ncbi:MAG: thiamine-phosphate kinase [Dehalococcoidia bacterium]|nr:thiamine-phosphate kinase [Dehalococcoidia bacterium]
MKVADVGEFGLIELVSGTIRGFKPSDLSPHSGLPSAFYHAPSPALVDIGDDTTVWRSQTSVQLATTDTLVEDVHFSLAFATWRELGWKSLAVNISDIAAMGGLPRYALVTLGLPGDLEAGHIIDLYKGMLDIAWRFGIAVVGGDMVRSREIFITVALVGEAPPRAGSRTDYLLRSGAKEGDRIVVTGHLGSSAAGLKMLSQGLPIESEAAAYLREAHLRPVPRVREGELIRGEGGLSAMDISDGLVADLTKVCQASGVGGTVFVDTLPIHPFVRAHFPEEATTLALSGGEDYELLFTAPADLVARVQRAIDTPVTVIGQVTAERAGVVRLLDGCGQEIQPRQQGWDHFRRE